MQESPRAIPWPRASESLEMPSTEETVKVGVGARSIYVVSAIVLLGAALRFYAIGDKSVWLDEAYSIWLADQPTMEMWRWLVRIDHHPPLYYSLLHVWQMYFGDAQGTVRMLSAMCGTLAIPLLYSTGRTLFDDSTGILAALILALSPFHVRFAQEVRMYALLALTAALAFACLAHILVGRGDETARDDSGGGSVCRYRRLH